MLCKLYFVSNLIKNLFNTEVGWSPWEQLKYKWCETGSGIQLLADCIDSIYLLHFSSHFTPEGEYFISI